MKFQYYHGTSDLFLESILEHGLGGVNPNYEFRYLDTLKRVFEIAEQTLMDVTDFRKIYDTTRAMSMQAKLKLKGSEELLNFRHDGTYIALSLERAISYATLNKYGSEILSTIIKLINLLEEHGVDYLRLGTSIKPILEIRDLQPKPIIIKILELDENKIDKEDGKTGKEALDFLRSILPQLSDEEKFKFLQICNFKLLEPIPPVNLEVYEVDFEGRFGRKDFEFTMARIK